MKRNIFLLSGLLLLTSIEISLYRYGKTHKGKNLSPGPLEQAYRSKITPNLAAQSYFWDRESELSPQEAYQNYQKGSFTNFQDTIGEGHRAPEVLWIYMELDTSKAASLICVRWEEYQFHSFHKLTFYEIEDAEIQFIPFGKTGKYQNRYKKPKELKQSDCCVLLPANFQDEKISILVKVENFISFPNTFFSYFSTINIEKEAIMKSRHQERHKRTFVLVFISILINFLLYTLLQYFQIKKPAYLWYAFYLFGIILYHTEQLESLYAVNWLFGYVVTWHYCYEVSIVTFIYVSYIYFMNSFLELEINRPKAASFLRIMSFVMLTFPVLDVIIWSVWSTYVSMKFFFMLRVVLFLLVSYFFFLVWKTNSKATPHSKKKILYKYAIYGSLSLIIGVLINVSLKSLDGTGFFPQNSFWGEFINYTRIGILAENLFFILGLSYKARLDMEEIDDFQKRIIYFEQKVEELHQKALQARIPSHTATNILKDIKTLHEQKKHQEAEQYSSLFTDFLRQHYQRSLQKDAVLSEELAAVEDYVQLRSIHPDKKIQLIKRYHDIDLGYYKIPSGMLFPIIENAIDHAFRDNEKDKQVIIEIQETALEHLLICISDNGRGFHLTKDNRRQSTGLKSVLDICKKEGIDLSIVKNSPRGTTITLRFNGQ